MAETIRLNYGKGFYQTSGLTFDESFSKIICFLISTFRFMLSSNIIRETYLRKGFSYVFRRIEVYHYLEETYLCNFNRKIVRVQAALLTKDSKEDTIGAMFQFIFYTEHDESVMNLPWQHRQASDFLSRGGRGVCADRAITFVAMLRSVNIPSRVASGYWNGNSHAWTEIYYWGAWRTLDPSNKNFVQWEEAIIPSGPYKGETYLKWVFDGDFFFSDEYAELMKQYEKVRLYNTDSNEPFLYPWYEWIFYKGGT